jgi:hypothetical protein
VAGGVVARVDGRVEGEGGDLVAPDVDAVLLDAGHGGWEVGVGSCVHFGDCFALCVGRVIKEKDWKMRFYYRDNKRFVLLFSPLFLSFLVRL